MVWLFEQLRLAQQVQPQRLPARFIVGPPRHLNQPATPVKLTVAIGLWRVAQTQRQLPGVVPGQVTVVTQLTHVTKLPGFMPDLGDEPGDAQPGIDGVAGHGGVESGNKNAGLQAGAGEDLK